MARSTAGMAQIAAASGPAIPQMPTITAEPDATSSPGALPICLVMALLTMTPGIRSRTTPFTSEQLLEVEGGEEGGGSGGALGVGSGVGSSTAVVAFGGVGLVVATMAFTIETSKSLCTTSQIALALDTTLGFCRPWALVRDVRSTIDTAWDSVAIKAASLGPVFWICTVGTEAAEHITGIVGTGADDSISLPSISDQDCGSRCVNGSLLTHRAIADLAASALDSLRRTGAIELSKGNREEASGDNN
jgi:hypothetical protein